MTTLPPPTGYKSWLHYAVENMPTRQLHLDSIYGEHWGRVVQREEMEEAVRMELARVEEAD